MPDGETSSPRVQFEHELYDLQQDLLRMGGLVEQMLHKSAEAYTRSDLTLVPEVLALEDQVDRFNREIEQTCLNIIALQGPVARDLRFVASTMKIIGDIERVGDYCVDIAKMATRMADKPPLSPQPLLLEMATVVNRMMRDTLQAFVNHDLALIETTVQLDDEVDALNKRIINLMVESIKKDVSVTEQAIGEVMVARYLERIADHVTNVGERVYYVESGQFKELHQ
jgi:phosphate transport system protein